ncbi:MAG TPA: hypothetical protein VEA17_11825, partial [Bordetella sp.]|nr:hypothetical protein [Bordetella sp.]
MKRIKTAPRGPGAHSAIAAAIWAVASGLAQAQPVQWDGSNYAVGNDAGQNVSTQWNLAVGEAA